MDCRPVYKGIRHANDAALKSFIQKERTTQRNSQKLNENDLPGLIAQEENLTAKRQAYVENSQYFDKRTKQLAPQFYQDRAEMGVFKQMSDEITAVATNRKYLQDQIILSQFKDFLIKGESLKRVAHVVGLRKGFKAVSSDFDFYYDTLSSYFGMDVKDFADGQGWSQDSHIAYFQEHNDAAAYGTGPEAMAAIDFERAIISNMNLVEMVRSLPQFESYAKGLSALKGFFEGHFLVRHPVFTDWGKGYLAGQERTTFLSKAHRSTYYSELGKFFLSIHFKQNFKGKNFDLGLHNSGVHPNSILKSIDISTPEGRNLYALQFPQFIMAMKSADNLELFKVQNGRDYSEWFDVFKENEFIDRLGLNDNNERSFLVLEDNYNLTENNIYRLRSEYEKLPSDLREMLEIYALITNGFDSPSGSINDVMGTGVLEGVSTTLDQIQRTVTDGDPVVERWRENFMSALPHAEGMSRYYSTKDKNKGASRETVLLPKDERNMHKRGHDVGRLVSEGRYTREYLRVGKLGIHYDPDINMTTAFEPLVGLTSLEIDNLMNKGSLVKHFVRRHNYRSYDPDTNSNNYYVLPNGAFARLNYGDSTWYTAVFEVVSNEDVSANSGEGSVFERSGSLKVNEDGANVYSGKLTKELVGANTDKVFVIEGYGDISSNNFAQRDAVRSMDNAFEFQVRKTQSGRFNLYLDNNGEVNSQFKQLVDDQIQTLKESADGREIVFPEKGFSRMSQLQTKAPAAFDYLTSQLKEHFGIDYKVKEKAPVYMTEQEKADAIKDFDVFYPEMPLEVIDNLNEPLNAEELLNQFDKERREAKDKKNKC